MPAFRRLAAAALAIAAAAIPTAVLAQAQDYPSKPVRIIVSFTAGGTTDVIARHIAQKLSERWKQPVVIENKPGAGGTLGTDYVVTQPADGYTLLTSSSGPISVSPILSKKLATDPWTAIVPVILFADVPNVLVTAPDLNVKSAEDLVREGKAKPGSLNYGSTGTGTVSHLAAAQFAQVTGFEATHIPYKGAGAVTDLMAGRLQFMFATLPSVIGQIRGGKLKPLAQVTTTRHKTLPDTPTMTELGYKGMETGSWFGLFAPKGTPQPIIDKLNATINEILKEPSTLESLEQQGAMPKGGSPKDFADMIRRDSDGWRAVIEKAKITAE
jgi:tripartite-type tricarboxylate transporter receptor subunit TctC